MKLIFFVAFLTLNLFARHADLGNVDSCSEYTTIVLLKDYSPNDGMTRLLSPRGSYFAQLVPTGIKLWDLHDENSNVIVFEPPVDKGQGHSISFSPDEDFLVMDMWNEATHTSNIAVIDIETFNVRYFATQVSPSPINSTPLAFSSSGNLLAFVSKEQFFLPWVKVLNLRTNILSEAFNASGNQPIAALDFLDDDTLVVKPAIHFADILLFDIKEKILTQRFKSSIDMFDGAHSPFKSLVSNKEASLIATHSTDLNIAIVWRLSQTYPTYEFTWSSDLPMLNLASTSFIAITSKDANINFLNGKSERKINIFESAEPLPTSLSFFDENRYFVVGFDDGFSVVGETTNFTPLCGGEIQIVPIVQFVPSYGTSYFSLDESGMIMWCDWKFWSEDTNL